MGYLGKIGSFFVKSRIGETLVKAAKESNATKQLYGSLIGTSKNGIQVFRQVAKDVVTTTSFKNGKMFKQIQQFARTGNDAKIIVKDLSKGTVTNIFHTFKNGDIIRNLHAYTKKIGENSPLKVLKDVTVDVYKNGVSSLRIKNLDEAMNGFNLKMMRKGKDVITKNLKFVNNGKVQAVASDPLNFLL